MVPFAKGVIKLRPWAFNRCEDFTFQLCQQQGWFKDKDSLEQLTDDDKKQAYWINNWEIAVVSYIFWSNSLFV